MEVVGEHLSHLFRLNVDVAKKGKGDWSLLVTIYMSMDIYIPVKGDTVYGRPGLPTIPKMPYLMSSDMLSLDLSRRANFLLLPRL